MEANFNESDYHNYQLQVGDGVSPRFSEYRGRARGVIRLIVGVVATVEWIAGKTGIEEVRLDELHYHPTEQQIEAEKRAIQDGWSKKREREANCHKSPRVSVASPHKEHSGTVRKSFSGDFNGSFDNAIGIQGGD